MDVVSVAKTRVGKRSKNCSKNIQLKVPQLSSNTKIKPDVSGNTTCSTSMDVNSVAKTRVGKRSKNSSKNIPVKAWQWATNVKSEPEISSYRTWSPYVDGIVGIPKSVAEILGTDAIINFVLYGPRNARRLPIFKRMSLEHEIG
ncbi:unnamed protein product [Dovyalis caffra]|uniref:Uncharacterized protein n=1 Tax=Dovyalis caffra TaxID=77055 RepID=A0AAV1RN17_9ROSI|nr:unnamed protein product [Dovyalis caffra]